MSKRARLVRRIRLRLMFSATSQSMILFGNIDQIEIDKECLNHLARSIDVETSNQLGELIARVRIALLMNCFAKLSKMLDGLEYTLPFYAPNGLAEDIAEHADIVAQRFVALDNLPGQINRSRLSHSVVSGRQRHELSYNVANRLPRAASRHALSFMPVARRVDANRRAAKSE